MRPETHVSLHIKGSLKSSDLYKNWNDTTIFSIFFLLFLGCCMRQDRQRRTCTYGLNIWQICWSYWSRYRGCPMTKKLWSQDRQNPGHEPGIGFDTRTCRPTTLQMNGSYDLTSKIIFSDEVQSFACRSVATNRLTSVGVPSSERSLVRGQRCVAGS